MLDEIEAFTKAHEHTITVLGPLSTFAAVIVSLWLARRASRAAQTQLKASASITFIMHPTIAPEDRPDFLTVSFTNSGNMALRIPFSFFCWKLPFTRGFLIVNPMDGYGGNHFISQKQYPIEIAPRASHTAFISELSTFESEAFAQCGKASFLDRLRFRYIRAVVRTDDGMTFKVKLSQQVRDVWSRALSAPKAVAARQAAGTVETR